MKFLLIESYRGLGIRIVRRRTILNTLKLLYVSHFNVHEHYVANSSKNMSTINPKCE